MVDILEFLLRSYFKAPKLPFLTTIPYMGDEFPRLVRLHPAAFTLIGVKPGYFSRCRWFESQIAWCDRFLVSQFCGPTFSGQG